MSGKDLVAKIRNEKIAGQNKRALIVEGADDVDALTILLTQHYSEWEQAWVIAPAGNKSRVQEVLKVEANWVGLVDRDEWDEGVIAERTTELPNLMILPRFCMENYLISPAEIWQALPTQQQVKVEGGQARFAEVMLAELPKYLRHGVLWKVVTPLWSGLRALGFKEALAAEDSVDAAQNDRDIQQYLHAWDELLDPERIFQTFEQQLELASRLPAAEQLRTWVHGKVFWKRVVHPEMSRLFGQVAEQRLRTDILKRLPWPHDWQALAVKLGLQRPPATPRPPAHRKIRRITIG